MFREGLARHPFWILLLLASALEIAFIGLSQIRLPVDSFRDVYVYYGLAFLVYALTILYVRFYWSRCFFSPELILIASIVFRLTLLMPQPLLSDDLYRYIWDGMVANAGIDPYRYVPNSDHLIGLRDAVIYPRLGHPDVHTIYPPLLQFVFQTVTFFTTSPLAMKAVFVMFDLAIIVVTMRLLRFLDKSIAWVLIYAWNPLVAMETALNGHADTIPVFFMMLGILLAVKARSIWAALALSASFLAKFFALVLVPFLEDVRTRWKTVLVVTAVSATLVAAAYWPFLGSRDYWWAGLKTYGSTWEFNSSVYAITYDILKDHMIPENGILIGMVTDNRARLASKLLLAGCTLLAIVVLLFRHYRLSYHDQKPNILTVAFIVTGLSLLVSPTLHPWYLLWILPSLCIRPNVAWILLTGLVVLSYDAFRTWIQSGSWSEDPVIRWWIYGPFYAVLLGRFAWKSVSRFRKAHPGESS